MNERTIELLTATRLATLRKCPRKQYYRYELGLSRVRKPEALRIGSVFHAGMEAHNKLASPSEAIGQALKQYDTVPEWMEPYDWAIERETVMQLMNGHFWRHENDDITIIETERQFNIPLVNPETGATSRSFRLAGKIDGIARHGRTSVMEYKTAGEDIGPNSDYWMRLRCDPQIAQYVIAARDLGHNVGDVIYDATRKPSIRPKRATPDDKRKRKADGTLYANQRDRDETPAEFGERLRLDIGERPDFYFQRHEVPLLDDELETFQLEVWQQAKHLLELRKHKRWFRNVSRFTCNHCDFADVCLNNVTVTPDNVPGGYEILQDVHPELTEKNDDDKRTTETATEPAATGSDAKPGDFKLC